MAKKPDRNSPFRSKQFQFPVELYPRSAHYILTVLESHTEEKILKAEPEYVGIDISNFKNDLRSHLQRIMLGEDL